MTGKQKLSISIAAMLIPFSFVVADEPREVFEFELDAGIDEGKRGQTPFPRPFSGKLTFQPVVY